MPKSQISRQTDRQTDRQTEKERKKRDIIIQLFSASNKSN